LIIVDRDVTEDDVVKGSCPVLLDLLPYHERLAGMEIRIDLGLRKPAATTVIGCNRSGIFIFARRFADFVESFSRTKASISMAALQKLVSILLINLFAFGLHIRTNRSANIGAFVPAEARNPKAIVDHLDRILDEARLVRILNPEKKLAMMFPGDQEGI
jgi:hypothetical protein